MGRFLITLLVPLTYLHFGGATLIVRNQPPHGTVGRPMSTHRSRQPFVNHRTTGNVFGIDSRSLQWPRPARRRGDIALTRQRPTQVWVPEPHGLVTQWPQGQATQTEWIPIESIPKGNNPSEWIQRQNVPPPPSPPPPPPPPTFSNPEVTTRKTVPRHRRPIAHKPSRTQRKKTFSSRKKKTRKMSKDEALNLMEEYVNRKLAFERGRALESERTTTASPILPSSATEIVQSAALPQAFDFLSGHQFAGSAGRKTDKTVMQDQYVDLRNQSDIQHIQSVNHMDAPSLVPISDNADSIDFYSSAFKAITDAFRLAEASSYNDVYNPQPDNKELHIVTDTSSSNTSNDKTLNIGNLQENVSNPDTYVSDPDTFTKDILSLVLPRESVDIPGSTGHYMNRDNITYSEGKPLTPTGELPKPDNQTILDIPAYSPNGKVSEIINRSLKTEDVPIAVEVGISTQEPPLREKPMAHSLDNIKEITKSDPPRQIPSPRLEQDLPNEAAIAHSPQRELRRRYDIFEGRKQQQEVDNLDLFSSEPPVDRNHPFSKGFKSSKYQQFEMRGNQIDINTNTDVLHKEPSFYHSVDNQHSQTLEQPPFEQTHTQTVDPTSYHDRQNDLRYLQQYDTQYQHQETGQNAFKRRKAPQREIHHIEISIPNSGWETHASSVYGIDPSETQQPQYYQPVVENQSFERRRKPTSNIRQPPGPMSSYQTHTTSTQSSWSNPDRAREPPYTNGFDRHSPDPYASDYMRRDRPPLSHFEKPSVVRTGHQQHLVPNQVSNTAVEDTTPIPTTEDPPTESVPEFRSNDPSRLQSWPQRQSHVSSGRTWESYPNAPQSTWPETQTSHNGWERRDNGITNNWQHSVPTRTSAWTRDNTGYDAQGGYNTQNDIYGNNEQNQYGQENTQHGYTEPNEYSHNEYNTQEGYTNEAQTIDYTDGTGNGGNDDSDEDDR